MSAKPFVFGLLWLTAFAVIAARDDAHDRSHGQQETGGGVVAGTVRDELGRPVPGVSVTVRRQQALGDSRWVTTDDRGQYRFVALPAGSYTVSVDVVHRTLPASSPSFFGIQCMVPPPPRSVEDFDFARPDDIEPVLGLIDTRGLHGISIQPGLTPPAPGPDGQRFSYVTTFAPAATSLTDARVIEVGSTTRLEAVDIQLQLRPAGVLKGRFSGLVRDGDRIDLELVGSFGSARSTSDGNGTFTFLGVPAGPATLRSLASYGQCDVSVHYGSMYAGQGTVNIASHRSTDVIFTIGPSGWLLSRVGVGAVNRAPAPIVTSQERSIDHTAAITGTIVDDRGQPLERIRVRATSAEIREGRTAVTDRDGRYVISSLRPGAYTVVASRDGYLDWMYGRRHAAEDGTTIVLGGTERFVADMTVPRPAVISGTVRDSHGNLVGGIRVSAGSTHATTDDRGQYRLWPLHEGDYVVRYASWRPDSRQTTTLYYPGVGSPAAATRVRTRPGTETGNIDVEWPSGSASLTVVVTRTDGKMPSDVWVTITGDTLSVLRQSGTPADATPRREERTVVFEAIPAGAYRATASMEAFQIGAASLKVDPRSTERVTVTTRPVRAEIHLHFSQDREPRSEHAGVRWRLVRVDPQARLGWDAWLGAQSLYARHEVDAGRYLLRVLPAQNWTARSAILDGADVLDAPFDVRPGDAVDIAVTLSPQSTMLSGSVMTGDSTPTQNATVVVFSTERAYWTPMSRRIRLVRPRSDGAYQVAGLPAGRYAVVAVPIVPPGQRPDSAFLEQLLTRSVVVELAEGRDVRRDLLVR